MKDNWAHRAVNMRCRTCMWHATKVATFTKGTIGRCRRHAPTMSGWPVVYDGDWCGDHKIDEDKIAETQKQDEATQ